LRVWSVGQDLATFTSRNSHSSFSIWCCC